MVHGLMLGMLAFADEGAAVPAPAGMAWSFDAPRRYVVKTDLHLIYAAFLRAFENREIRVSRIQAALDTTCAVRFKVGKKGWELECLIQDLALRAAPVVGTPAEAADVVLADLDKRFTGTRVEVTLTRDGRVTGIGLAGIEGTTDRETEIIEVMRQVFSRAFASMDLLLPEAGADAWLHNAPWSLNLFGTGGTLGSVSTTQQVLAVGEAGVVMGSQGVGAVQLNSADTLDLEIVGSGRFLPAAGTLAERQVLVIGKPTASSRVSVASPAGTYQCESQLTWVPEGGRVPSVGATGIIDPR